MPYVLENRTSEGGIKQKNLDLVLDLMDEFVELKESVMEGEEKLCIQ